MSVWRLGCSLGVVFSLGVLSGGAAWAQELTGVNGGLNSDNGAISAGNINRLNGINANGTPRQQNPGASMTNGAGNSTMTPGVTGPVATGNSGLSTPQTVPPTVILHGNAAPSGQ